MEAATAERPAKGAEPETEPDGKANGAAKTETDDKPKREKRDGSYTVLRLVEQPDGPTRVGDGDYYVIVAEGVAARNDRQAIESCLDDDDSGTFVAVPRFNRRTVEPQTVTKRVWK